MQQELAPRPAAVFQVYTHPNLMYTNLDGGYISVQSEAAARGLWTAYLFYESHFLCSTLYRWISY